MPEPTVVVNQSESNQVEASTAEVSTDVASNVEVSKFDAQGQFIRGGSGRADLIADQDYNHKLLKEQADKHPLLAAAAKSKEQQEQAQVTQNPAQEQLVAAADVAHQFMITTNSETSKSEISKAGEGLVKLQVALDLDNRDTGEQVLVRIKPPSSTSEQSSAVTPVEAKVRLVGENYQGAFGSGKTSRFDGLDRNDLEITLEGQSYLYKDGYFATVRYDEAGKRTGLDVVTDATALSQLKTVAEYMADGSIEIVTARSLEQAEQYDREQVVEKREEVLKANRLLNKRAEELGRALVKPNESAVVFEKKGNQPVDVLGVVSPQENVTVVFVYENNQVYQYGMHHDSGDIFLLGDGKVTGDPIGEEHTRRLERFFDRVNRLNQEEESAQQQSPNGPTPKGEIYYTPWKTRINPNDDWSKIRKQLELSEENWGSVARALVKKAD